MGKRPSPKRELPAALEILHLVIVEKGVATEELHATNQELGAILDGLLSIRGDLKGVIADDCFDGLAKTKEKPKTNPKLLDLGQLERQADEVLKKGQAVVEQSTMLRMKSQKVRAALLSTREG